MDNITSKVEHFDSVEIGVKDIMHSSHDENHNKNATKYLEPKIEPAESVEITVKDILHYSEEPQHTIVKKEVKQEFSKNVEIDKVSKHATKYLEPKIKLVDSVKITLKDVLHCSKEPKPMIEREVEPENMENMAEIEDSCTFQTGENLHADEQLILNYSRLGKGIITIDKSSMIQEFATCEMTDVSEDLKKAKVIRPSVYLRVTPDEYTVIHKNYYVCNYCMYATAKNKSIKDHIRKKHRATRIIVCPYCPYQTKFDLNYHIISQHKSDEEIRWFICYICNAKFKFKSGIRTHITGVHLGQLRKSQRCRICQKEFRRPDKLKLHIQRFHQGDDKKYCCQQCNYSSWVMKNFKLHMQRYHTDINSLEDLKCRKCDFKTKFTRSLHHHMRSHNAKLTCEKCSAFFRGSANLKLHLMTHQTILDQSVMKYRCDHCDYKTYRLYSLNIHKLNHVKPDEVQYFYCYHCDFKANRKDNLKTHVLKHFKKEEVKMSCYRCNYSTKKRSLLTDHLKTHSKNQEKTSVQAISE